MLNIPMRLYPVAVDGQVLSVDNWVRDVDSSSGVLVASWEAFIGCGFCSSCFILVDLGRWIGSRLCSCSKSTPR
jgi:hypothetical protein